MRKCIWRKVQDLGLACEYMKNEEVRMVSRMVAALALRRPEDVPDGWLEIHSRVPVSYTHLDVYKRQVYIVGLYYEM